jgi:23S rRNA C2498 (ribose-2'-O)-methylase RlmM
MNAHNIPTKSQKALQSNGVFERMQLLIPSSQPQFQNWMVQISQNAVEVWQKDFLNILDPHVKLNHCGRDFYEICCKTELSHKQILDTGLPRWICPIEHRWPSHPDAVDFAERAAQGLIKKFGMAAKSNVVVSPTPELRNVAAHVRARLNQLFGDLKKNTSGDLTDNTANDRRLGSTLTALIYRKGVLAGITKNMTDTGCSFDAGLGFLSAKEEQNKVSRAAGKILEVLSLLKSVNIDCNDLNNWLELGAAPGGMTQALVLAGASVTAVDLANLKPELLKNENVTHLKVHSDEIITANSYSALLSDMNGPSELAVSTVARLIKTMKPGAVIVHTLKVQDFESIKSAVSLATHSFEMNGAQVILVRHLFHNRKELTIIAVRR